MDVSSLKALNEAFRSITEPDSISPDTLASLLNRIIEVLENANSTSELSSLLMSYYTKNQINDLLEQISSVQIPENTNNFISCYIENDSLYVRGAEHFLALGYKPYIFRYVRKHNRYKKKAGTRKVLHGPMRKGWQIYEGEDKIKLDGSKILVRNGKNRYYSNASNFINTLSFTQEEDPSSDGGSEFHNYVKVYFGRKQFYFYHGSVRLPFAIAFSKPQPSRKFDYSLLVSNFAEFKVSIIADDSEDLYVHFSL